MDVGKQVKKLEAVQNKAARFVTSQHHWETSVTKLKDTLGWRSLQERRFIARMTLWYKAIHAQAAVSVPSYYAPKPVDPNDPGTRASHDQQYPSHTATTDPWKYSFFQRNVRVWNILPPHLVIKPTEHDNDSYKYQHSIAAFKDTWYT